MDNFQERQGLSELQSGLIYEIVSSLIGAVGALLLSFFFLAGFLGIAIGFLVLLAALVLAILALVRLYGGFSKLEPYVQNMELGKIGAILAVIPFVDFVGWILIGISLYFLGEKYGNDTLKIGGIITAIPIINFIGLILSYSALNYIGNYYPTPSTLGGSQGQGQYQQSYYPPSPPPPQVYQVGQGTLRGNVATFTLYSTDQLIIRRIALEGTDVYAVSFYPSQINRGNNNLTVTLSSVPVNAIQGALYKLKIEFDNNLTLFVNLIYSPS